MIARPAFDRRSTGGVLVGHGIAEAGEEPLRGRHGDRATEPDDLLAAALAVVDQELVLVLGIERREGGLGVLQLATAVEDRDLTRRSVSSNT